VSILAGIVSRRPGLALSEPLCDRLKQVVSRNSSDKVTTFRDPRAAFFKVDLGAFGEAGFNIDKSGSVAMLAGEPLLELGVANSGRAHDLELMQDAFTNQQWDVFAKSQGTYCAAHYDPRTGVVTLIADRLALRPIYYWAGPDYVVFASALRILESLPEVPKRMDLVAVTEITTLGCTVGSRTPYCSVKAIKAGEVLQFAPDEVRCLRYWRWDSIQPSSLSREAQLERSHNQFLKAVQRRLRNDKEVLATLSGGLDSRSVVSALRSQGVKVNTLNFYRVLESQDQVFAADFAKAAGTNHRAVPLPPWNAPVPFEQRVTNAWQSTRSTQEAGPERPQLLWMGDGGSVGVGHVFVEDNVVAALREGQVEKAIHAYRPRMVSRLLRDGSSSSVSELMVEDIRAELEDLHYEDPARAFHMFLMLYEQRYDLSQHFENLDLHRLEFQLPFFDFDFLAGIVSAPVDWCLGHGFYMDWLALFPASATAVPWQAYPTHRPCPLPIPEGLSYQWGKTKSTVEIEAKRRELLNTADQVLGAGNFPDPILKKYFLQVTTWLYKAGLRDGGSTIKAAQTYHRYWAACQGEFAVGPASSWNCA